MWIIFEGLDKSGKTTLEWAFLKKTNYKHNVVDRGPVGYFVFDKIFNRETNEGNNEFIFQAKRISRASDIFIVYCKVDGHIAKKRLDDRNEICPYNYSDAQDLMDKYIYSMYEHDKVIEINTGIRSVDECIEIICKNIGIQL